MPQVDLNGIEVIKKLRKEEGGIPWFAITEPGGKILATSDGPLGNIGLPSSVVSLRHFRKMLEETIQRITREEVDALITSLSSRT
jgi:hypothetical protein